jgi:hypothetical protein
MPVEQQPSPIIIYGAPRSGTTYLNRILSEHPDIFISREIRLFLWVNESLNVLTQSDEFLYHHRDAFVAHLRSVYPDLIRSFYRTLEPNVRYWGDKYPHYASPEHPGCLETIRELFPQTRFIHIIRDGRDVVTSLIRKRKPSGEPWADFEQAHLDWMSHVDRGAEFGRALPPGNYFELQYEDLIADDPGMARRVFDFLEIAMHPNVEAFCRSQQEERTPLSGPTRDLSTGAENSDWERALTPREQQVSLDLIGDHLVKYGYETGESLQELRRTVEAGLADPAAETPLTSRLSTPSGKWAGIPWEPHQQRQAAMQAERVRATVTAAIPPGAHALIVAKGDDEMMHLEDRLLGHFPQAEDGSYLGYYPATDAEAIRHFESLQERGAQYIVFPRSSRWWLDHYADFHAYLRARSTIVADDETCIIFALSATDEAAALPGSTQHG